MDSVTRQYSEQLRAVRTRLIGTKIEDEALSACITGLARLEGALRRPLRVVVLGERNSGKTSVTDLLIGQELLPVSAVASSRIPVLVTYAETPAVHGLDRDGRRTPIDSGSAVGDYTGSPYQALRVAAPIERLEGYELLDTPPATNPSSFVKAADIVIWCTVATRAWTESERATWAALPQRCHRRALLVATHKDGLEDDSDAASVLARLRSVTDGAFRDVVLVDAHSVGQGPEDGLDGGDATGADALSSALSRLAGEIRERRMRKAEKLVRRLARLTFHQFARDALRPGAAGLLLRWESEARYLLGRIRRGELSASETIEALLAAYAGYAEKLRPGVVRGDDTVSAGTSRALTTPMRWPRQTSAAARLVETLARDLTALLRMLAAHSAFAGQAAGADYRTARAVVLALADLDGAFDALGRMLGTPLVSARP